MAGANTIGVRVDNGADGGARLRAVVGVVSGGMTQLVPTDPTWRSTTNAALTGQPTLPNVPNWTSTTFSDSNWNNASLASRYIPEGLIPYDPVTFEIPLPSTWLTAGPYLDAFFYRTVTIPGNSTVWMRIASTGTAGVYLNGEQMLDQPPYISTSQTYVTPPNGASVTAGIYNVTPYLHGGENSFAVHVAAASNPLGGSPNSNQIAATVVDLLVVHPDGSLTQIGTDQNWKASPTSAAGWTTGTHSAQWSQAVPIDQASLVAQPPNLVPNLQAEEVSFSAVAGMSVGVAVVVLLFFLVCLALQIRLNSARQMSASEAFDRTALVFAPSLALVALLFAISIEPSIVDPFPTTPFWFALVVLLCPVTAGVLFVDVGGAFARRLAERMGHYASAVRRGLGGRSWGTLLTHATLWTAVVITIFFVFYRLDYESYWQDELASLYAAQGVLHYGIPEWVTGVIYTKSELFSYMLAPLIALFGTNPYVLRGVSAFEHVLTVIALFYIGRYLLGRLEGLISALLMAFSSFAVQWARELRMYQQAQLLVVIVLYLFYRAVQPGARTRYIYLSMLATVAMYLSHELTFIVLPVLVIYLFVAQGLTWMRNRHWWIAGLSAIACILAQLSWWRLTRHPLLGTDATTRPLIGFIQRIRTSICVCSLRSSTKVGCPNRTIWV